MKVWIAASPFALALVAGSVCAQSLGAAHTLKLNDSVPMPTQCASKDARGVAFDAFNDVWMHQWVESGTRAMDTNAGPSPETAFHSVRVTDTERSVVAKATGGNQVMICKYSLPTMSINDFSSGPSVNFLVAFFPDRGAPTKIFAVVSGVEHPARLIAFARDASHDARQTFDASQRDQDKFPSSCTSASGMRVSASAIAQLYDVSPSDVLMKWNGSLPANYGSAFDCWGEFQIPGSPVRSGELSITRMYGGKLEVTFAPGV